MENTLLVGLSRQMALSRELDVIANNIANIDTTGFKADNAAFSEYLMPGARDGDFPGKDRRVSFVQDRATWIDLSPGALERTGNPLDVAIDGKGYLVVQTPRGQRYTRNGSFAINATGQLVTKDGDQVVATGGAITFQPGDHNVEHQRHRHRHRERRLRHAGCAARTTANRRHRQAAIAAEGRAARRSWRPPESMPVRRRRVPTWCKARSRNRMSARSSRWRA